MEQPTAGAIREHAAPFSFAAIGYPPPGDDQNDKLDPRVDSAVAYILRKTARDLDGIRADEEPLMLDAVTMRVQQQAVNGDIRRVRDSAATGSRIKSFRAGDYQETRATIGEDRRAGVYDSSRINPWDDLAELILMLATDEQRALLLEEAGGVVAPAHITVEHDAGASYNGYGYGWY